MNRLGYTRYVSQGGDWGSVVAEAMGRQAPAGLLGIQAAGLPILGTIHHPITVDRRIELENEPRWWKRLPHWLGSLPSGQSDERAQSAA